MAPKPQARPVARHRLKSLIIALVTIVTLLAGIMTAVVITAGPASAATAQAVVDMPFSGQWAYNAVVKPPYTDANSSHPSVHAKYYGDWATDLYPPNSTADAGGEAVKLHVTSPDGAVTFSYNRSNDTCGANVAGHGIVLNVLVNKTVVGSIDYEHLDNISGGPYTDGMTIGYITKESLVGSPSYCYTVRHVHVELKNNTNDTYSCWVNHGYPGTNVTESDHLGVLGSTNTTERQACTSMPGGSGGTPPNLVGDVVATNQANGLEEVFYVGGDGGVWYRWQNADGSWSAEYTLGGGAKAITAARTADGRVEIFYVGGNNAIWYRWQIAPNTDSWSSEYTIAAGASQITAITESDGRIGVFYIGGDGAIYYRWQNTDGTWFAEERLPSGVKALSATKTIDGKIELFYIGGDNAVWHRWQTAVNTDSWSAEYRIGGGASAITATDQASGYEEIFYIGGNGAIWYRWQNADGSWSAEHTLSAGVHAITSTDTSDGRIQLFYVGGDNAVWSRWQTAPNTDTWSAEYRLGGGVG